MRDERGLHLRGDEPAHAAPAGADLTLLAQLLASGRFIEEHAAILFCGPTGVGKSFLAQAIALQACRQQRRVLFAKTSALLADLAGGRADGSYQPRLRRYLAPALLVLDDFGLREYTAAQAEDLYEIVSRRHRRGALILTTNRAPADLYALFPNPVLAEGLLDRLLNSAYIVTMLGRSYRPRQRPGGTGKEVPQPPTAPDDPGEDERRGK